MPISLMDQLQSLKLGHHTCYDKSVNDLKFIMPMSSNKSTPITRATRASHVTTYRLNAYLRHKSRAPMKL